MMVYNLADQETALALTMAFASGARPKKRYLFFAEQSDPRCKGFISESFLGSSDDDAAYVEMFLDYLSRAQGFDADDEDDRDEGDALDI